MRFCIVCNAPLKPYAAKFCSHKCRAFDRTRPLSERFWAKVVVTPGCWEWTGDLDKKGYGRIAAGATQPGHVLAAHRVSWELHFGPIPDGAWVLHRCDNPPCTNYTHLFLGDNASNVLDMTNKGRNRHKLGADDIAAIKIERANGATLRQLATTYAVTVQAIRYRLDH